MSYKLLNSIKVNGSIPVSKYVSTDSGIKLYISEVNSPIVNGYFALGQFSVNLLLHDLFLTIFINFFLLIATEADNDDGLPHTLEHLIFLGSEVFIGL